MQGNLTSMEGEQGLVVRGRVEIDMRQPFRSVKEAVMLFGEKVLAGEVYGSKLKEMQNKAGNRPQLKNGVVTAELEVTKQSLEKAKEEGNPMAYCLESLRQELEKTKKELQQLKARESHVNHVTEPANEIEELKFIENTSNKVEVKEHITTDGGAFELQKKRSVKFASPPLLTRVIVSEDTDEEKKEVHSPKKKSKKKPLIPLISGLFLKKKGGKESKYTRV